MKRSLQCTSVATALFCLLHGACGSTASNAQPLRDSALLTCPTFQKSGTPQVAWFSATNQPLKEILDIGMVDAGAADVVDETVFSPAVFRMIVTPARVNVHDFCTMNVCVQAKKLAPRCAGTAEYAIRFGLTPSKFGPGMFETESTLSLDDPKVRLDANGDALAGKKLVGSVSMPWMELASGNDKLALANFNQKKAKEVTIVLTNAGDRPIQLGEWEKYPDSNPALALSESTCSRGPIAPQGQCSLTLSRDANRASDEAEQGAFWEALSIDERHAVSLAVKLNHGSDQPVGVRNR